MEEEKVTPKKGKKTKSMRTVLVMGMLAAILAVGCWLWQSSELTLEMQLVGEAEIFLEYGQEYTEYGATLRLYGSRFFRMGMESDIPIDVEGVIDHSCLGEYILTYHTEYFGKEASVQRKVYIMDTQKPEIELLSHPHGHQYANGKYQEEGFTASDNYDGDLTASVIREESAGRVTYSVTDSSGNTCVVERLLPGYDPVPPQIELKGDPLTCINTGILFEDPGFTAWDNVDGDLTEAVTVDGEVTFYKPGKYPIQYSVTDAYGNITTVVRMVEVMAQPRPEPEDPGERVIYLTFDDGPGIYTPALLDILDEYNVKASFFVVDSGEDEMLRQIAERGHSIGIHTMTHDYESIYASPEAFFGDLYGMQEKIFQVTGIKTTLMRFPGGSSNTVSIDQPGIMTLLTQAVQDAGFQYFDWNVDSNDAGGAKTSRTVFSNVVAGVCSQKISVVLQHDIHHFSVNAVEEILRWGLDNGYTFLPLMPNSPECHHNVRN